MYEWEPLANVSFDSLLADANAACPADVAEVGTTSDLYDRSRTVYVVLVQNYRELGKGNFPP